MAASVCRSTPARRQIDDIHTYLQEYVPGFEQCTFAKTAPFLGIRETRRIVAQYMMTQEDVLGCRSFVGWSGGQSA